MMVAFTIYFERKFAGFFQGRVGPTYLGPWGSLAVVRRHLQAHLERGRDPRPRRQAGLPLAPYIIFMPAFLVMAVLPFGPVTEETPNLFGYQFDYVIANFDTGLVLFLAMGAIAVYGVVLAGWSSNSNYSLLGGLRAGAQMISYELAMGFSVVGVMLMAGSLNLVDIVDGQAGDFWDWYFIPQMVGGLIFFIATMAELNRTPFDLAEAEQELVAGYLTEYSGMRWGMFYVRRVREPGRDLGHRRHPVLRRLAGPVRGARLHPRAHLAASQDLLPHVHLHVGAVDHLPLSLQPADVHRLEGAAPACPSPTWWSRPSS